MQRLKSKYKLPLSRLDSIFFIEDFFEQSAIENNFFCVTDQPS